MAGSEDTGHEIPDIYQGARPQKKRSDEESGGEEGSRGPAMGGNRKGQGRGP